MGGAIADAVLQGQQPGACMVLLGQQWGDRVCLSGAARSMGELCGSEFIRDAVSSATLGLARNVGSTTLYSVHQSVVMQGTAGG